MTGETQTDTVPLEKVPRLHVEIILALFSAAALILTINLNFISSTASAEVLASISTPIIFSTGILVISLFAGAISLSMSLRAVADNHTKGSIALFQLASMIQTWTFFSGVTLIGIAVYLRIG